MKTRKSEVIVRDFDGELSVEFKTIDGVVYANANSMADRREIDNWKRSSVTKRYAEALSKSITANVRDSRHGEVDSTIVKIFGASVVNEESRNGKRNIFNGLILSSNGGTRGGTWIHEKLVLSLARYVSVDFEIWCDEQIATLIKDGEVILDKKQEPVVYTGEVVMEIANRMIAMEKDIKVEKRSKAGIKGHDRRKRGQLDTAKSFLGVGLDKDLNWVSYVIMRELMDISKKDIKRYIKTNRPEYRGNSWDTLEFPVFIWKRISEE